MSTAVPSPHGTDPGRIYPSPALSRADLVWRYAIAGVWYVIGLAAITISLFFLAPLS